MTNPPILIAAHNPSPMTGAGNNTYLIVGTDGRAALIDAGVGNPRHLADLDAQLTATGSRLDRVLVTHGHVDHASGAPALHARHPDAGFDKYPWPDEDARYAVPWRALTDGESISIGGELLIAIFTPGHSPDHLAFWHEASRTIFAGDLVIPGGSVMIQSSRGGNLAQYLASLERLIALDARVLLPAHGGRVDDPGAVLRQHIDHRRQRERQVIAALDSGRTSIEAIADRIYLGLDPALMPAARENVRAHLEKLRLDGLVLTDEAGRWASARSA